MSLVLKKSFKNDEIEFVTENLNKNKHFTVYQSIEFFNFFKTQKDIQPFHYSVWNEGKLKGWLLAIRFKHKKGYPGFLASRTVIWGGPLLFGELDSQSLSLDMLLEALIDDLRAKSALIEFRNLFDLSAFENIFKKYGFHLLSRMNCIIELSNKDKIYGNIKDSKSRQITKGLQHGAIITEAENIGQVKEFYNILKNLYHKKIKKPLPQLSFFEGFFHFVKQSGQGVILLVKYNQKIIGGTLCPISPGREIFEWYTGALNKEYKQLYPGVLATWAPIDYALKNNIPRFNFMGIGSPDKPYGVRDFKLQFGGNVMNYGRYTRINNPILFKLTKMGYRLLGFRE